MSVLVPVAPMWKLGWEREKKRKKERKNTQDSWEFCHN